MTRRLSIAACLVLASLGVAQPASPRERMLVSPQWLEAHLNDPGLVVIHVGMGDADRYRAGHIPGAQYVPMEAFAAARNGLLVELPAPSALGDLIAAHGITAASRVVLYFGKNEVSEATRVYLTFEYAGLGDRVALLQGGWPAWTGAGLPASTATPRITPTAVGALRTQQVTVDAAFMQANSHTPGIVLVDARDGASYDGISPRSAGHIPGAVSIPPGVLFTDTAELKPAAELAAIFAKAGVKQGDTVVAYCWLGQFATATLFAARTLGHKTLLYDGSFADWTARRLPLVAAPGRSLP